ncbi:MAG: DUF58 domain-containing protein [Fimbriimonadaceae bacterium]
MLIARLYALGFVVLVVGALYLGLRAVAREQAERRATPYSVRRGMRGVAGVALSTSSMFLLIVAVMLNSPPLFYMSTALLSTLAVSRLQAYLSVRGLKFDRFVPEKASVGELIAVELSIWSDRRIRRPLVTLVDQLPSRMAFKDRTSSLPLAPAFDVPMRTQYLFRPMRRGRFRWKTLKVYGTDALGLTTVTRNYDLDQSEILVVPNAIPLDIDLPGAAGFGISEAETGLSRGSGLEPRGIREYAQGDSMRYVHWPTVARTGKLVVKEFETGSHSTVAFFLQRTRGTDIGAGANSTLEHMCSHCAYLSDRMLRNGAGIALPTIEFGNNSTSSPHERAQEILIALAGIDGDGNESIASELLRGATKLPFGSRAYVFVAVADPELPGAIRSLSTTGIRVAALLYDAEQYRTKGDRAFESAMSHRYMDEITASGGEVISVPFVKVK